MKQKVEFTDYYANGSKIVEAVNAFYKAFGSAIHVVTVAPLPGAYNVYAINTDGDVSALVWFHDNEPAATVEVVCW